MNNGVVGPGAGTGLAEEHAGTSAGATRVRAAGDEASKWGWITSRLTLFASAVPIALVVMRVARVSHGQVRTELALIGTSSTLSVVFGALAPVIPYLMVAATAGLVVVACRAHADPRVRERTLILGTAAVCWGALTLLTTPLLQLAFLVGIWLLGLMVLFAFLYAWVVLHRFAPVRPWGNGVIAVAALTGFLIVQIGFDDRPWLPPEVITLTQAIPVEPGCSRRVPAPESVVDYKVIGYVVADSASSASILEDCGRTVLTVQAAAMHENTICRIDNQKLLSGFEARIDGSATLLHYLDGERPAPLQGCSRLLSQP